MKKSYVQEHSMKVLVEIDLGEINTLIDSLGELDSEASGSYRAGQLIGKLKTLRRDAAEDARDEFERMLQRD